MNYKEWKTDKLGNILTLKRGYDLPQQHRIKGTVPIYSSAGLTGFHNESKVKGPGVITGRYGTLGEVFYTERDYWPHNTTLYVKDFKGSNPKFISYFLKTIGLATSNDKTSVPGLNRNDIHEMNVSIPNLKNQIQIACILSSLDDKIELNRQTNQTLEAIARAIFKEWFVNFKYADNSSKIVSNELGDFPENWDVKALIDVAEITDFVANGSFASLAENVKYKSKKDFSILIRLTDFNRGFNKDFVYVDERAYKFLSKSVLKGNEIIISNVGANAGDIFRTPRLERPMTLGPNSIMIKPSYLSHYLYMFFSSYQGQHLIKNIITGSAQPKFNKTDFRKIKIVIPQKKVVDQFNIIYQSLEDKITSNIKENNTLTNIRDSLLPKLMKGEIEI